MRVSCSGGKDIYRKPADLTLDNMINELAQVIDASDMSADEFSTSAYIEGVTLKEAMIVYSSLQRECDGTNIVAFATKKGTERRYQLWRERSFA